jgi:hypothetical protein
MYLFVLFIYILFNDSVRNTLYSNKCLDDSEQLFDMDMEEIVS